MAWYIPKSQMKTLQAEQPVSTLEEMGEFIKEETEGNGKTIGKLVIKPFEFYKREYHFANRIHKEPASGENDELVAIGIRNLKFILPEYEIAFSRGNSHMKALEINVLFYKKAPDKQI